MTVTPSRSLYGLGAILLVSLTLCSRRLGNLGEPSFLILMGIAGVAYLLAVREFFSTPTFPRHVIIIGLLLAAVWHLAFLLTPPGSDDDIHRYLWDGHVQRLGYNPYIVVPNDPSLAGLHTQETRTLNHPDLPSPYPPGAEVFFRAVTAIHESIFALKVAFVLCDFAIVFVLLEILRGTHQPEHWVLAYAWNPLLAIEVAGTGHIDIVGVLLLLVSVGALLRRWRSVAALAFALAIAVKLLPVVLVPLYWKRVRPRDGALAALVVALLYLPFLSHGRLPIGSLNTYVRSFRFNDPIFTLLERVAPPQWIALMAVLVGFLTAIYLRRKASEWSPDAFAWPMAASLLCAPVVYPWYLVWLVPFVGSASTVPLLIWTVSIIPTYYVWHLRSLGRLWVLPGWVMPLEYGAVGLAAATVVFRRSKQRAAPPPSAD